MRFHAGLVICLFACRRERAPDLDAGVIITSTPAPIESAPVPSTNGPEPSPPITKLPPGSADTAAPWARKLNPAQARSSFEADFRKRMPGTSHTESAAGMSITYVCTYESIAVVALPTKPAAWKATITAKLDSDLSMAGQANHANDTGNFVFYPSTEEGRWSCDPKGYVNKGNSPTLPAPCMNIMTQCLGRHASQEEFDISLGK